MLMALNIPINFKLYVHGWYLRKDGKMSKSIGNVVYPMDVVNNYGLDALRYYLVREMPLGSDAIFSYDRFFEKFNVDLANDLGNLVSRSISMINKYQQGKVTKPVKSFNSFDEDVEKLTGEVINSYHNNFTNFLFQNGLNEVWNLIRRANKYIDETTPWSLAKDPARKEELSSVLYHLYEVIRVVAIMLNPVMPDASKTILTELGINELDSFAGLAYGFTEEAMVTDAPVILFKRLDIEEELKKYA
jgi:methionyl-tRNA synthetase